MIKSSFFSIVFIITSSLIFFSKAMDEKLIYQQQAISAIECFLKGKSKLKVFTNSEGVVMISYPNFFTRQIIKQPISYFKRLFECARMFDKDLASIQHFFDEYHDLHMQYWYEYWYEIQLFRLKEFLETKELCHKGDYDNAYEEIEKLKLKSGETFLKNNFGLIDIDTIVTNLIRISKSRISYIRAFEEDASIHEIKSLVSNNFYFKFIPLREYLLILRRNYSQTRDENEKEY